MMGSTKKQETMFYDAPTMETLTLDEDSVILTSMNNEGTFTEGGTPSEGTDVGDVWPN